MENEQTTPETEVSQGITEEQAVQEMLGRWGKTEKSEPEQEQPKAEATEETTESEQAEEATQEDETTEETEAEDDGEIEIDVAGEKFKVHQKFADTAKRIEAKAKEVEAGATRKFQEAADIRKAAEVEAQSAKQLHKFASANADLLADHRMVAKRLQTLENIDFNQVDTDTLTRLNAEYNQLQAARSRIEDQYKQNLGVMQDEEAKAFQAKREQGEKLLASRIKGWGPEHGKKLADYAIGKGAPAQVLNGITDAWMIEILDDAAYGHQMRQARPEITKRVAQAPGKTLTPNGVGTQKPAAKAKAELAMAKVRKTGNIDDAAMALLARAQSRKR